MSSLTNRHEIMQTRSFPTLPTFPGKPLQSTSDFQTWHRRIQLHLELLGLWDTLISSKPLSHYDSKILTFYLDSSIDNKLVERFDWSSSPIDVFMSICREFGEINIGLLEIVDDENGSNEDKKEIKEESGKSSSSAQPVNQPQVKDDPIDQPGPSSTKKNKKKKNKNKQHDVNNNSTTKEPIEVLFTKRDWFLSTRHQVHFCMNPAYFESMTPHQIDIPNHIGPLKATHIGPIHLKISENKTILLENVHYVPTGIVNCISMNGLVNTLKIGLNLEWFENGMSLVSKDGGSLKMVFPYKNGIPTISCFTPKDKVIKEIYVL